MAQNQLQDLFTPGAAPLPIMPPVEVIQEKISIGKEFPRLQRFVREKGIDIQQGSGPGFAEVFFKGDEISPDPTKHIVQLRDTGNFNPQTVATADVLHFLGGKEGRIPFDPEFFELKQNFIRNLPPQELDFAKKRFNEFKRQGKKGSNFTSFNNFMQNVWSDSLIRGGLFPELMVDPREREEFMRREPFNKKQNEILDRMNQIIRSK